MHIKQLISLCLNTTSWQATLLKNWPTIIGQLSNQVFIEKIHNDTLILHVNDSCLMQELYFLSSVLKDTINKSLEKPYIKKITLKKAPLPKTKKISSYEGASCPVKQVKLSKAEEHALDIIQDIELRSMLKAFCMRCHRNRLH